MQSSVVRLVRMADAEEAAPDNVVQDQASP